jgi:hypothetical protein
MFKSKKSAFSVSIAKEALESIFDECDRYDIDETGGRLVGSYRQKGTEYDIEVLGVIPPGPNAQRSPTSFFQDGDYQEKVFRSIEERHPNVEHLGNWHTHHVNGYPTLSAGDKTTYFKTVNHEKHNTDFFYALLVVRRNSGGNPRYDVKHYFFRRNDDTIYEIPSKQVRLLDTPALRPDSAEKPKSPSRPLQPSSQQNTPNPERAKDQDFFSEFYPNLKALLSKSAGALYWKGALELVDGSHANVVAMEKADDGAPCYLIATPDTANPALAEVSASYKERQFRSARQAVLVLQKDLDRALYRHKKG